MIVTIAQRLRTSLHIAFCIMGCWFASLQHYVCHYVTKGSESEQPVGAPFYQWVGCRDQAGFIFFSHSGS